MRSGTTADWIAFGFLLIGALAWGYLITEVNILDAVLEKVWDPLDDRTFILFALSGRYWLVRVVRRRRPTAPGPTQASQP